MEKIGKALNHIFSKHLKFVFVILILFFIGVFFWAFFAHEAIHWAACEFIIGKEAKIVIEPYFMGAHTVCGEGKLEIGLLEDFLYSLGPYLFEFLVMGIIYLIGPFKRKLFKLIPYILFADVIRNYFALFNQSGDFYSFFTSVNRYVVGNVLFILSLLVFSLILMRDLREFNKWVEEGT